MMVSLENSQGLLDVFVFVELVHQTLVPQPFQFVVVCLVIGLVVFSCAQKADVLLEVMVYLLQSVGMVDDGKEPPRPCERFRIAVLEEYAVEMVDESLHRLFGFHILLVAPAHQSLRGPTDFTLHLPFGCFRDVYVVAVAFESEEFVGFIGCINSFLIRVEFQLVFL